MKTAKHYGVITLSIFIMAIGVYFFKFPNNFCFGGVTGMAAVIARITPLSASTFTTIANLLLLAVAWLFVDRKFAMDTAYASILLSTLLVLLEKLYPMVRPLSGEPVLDLLFAIALPAIASALLFYIGASSGGTDVLAMLLKKYTNIKNIGNALFLSDLVMVLAACFVFDIETALYSFVGLTVKSFMIDNIIQSITLCKSVTISCSDPEPICDFILKELDRSATVVGGYGAYTHEPRSVIFTTMNRRQADRLRAYLHENHPHAFLSVSSTNEVFGKGFTQV